jgi:NAD(P)-dependent dehydrogenase (short-subunit alcohol dehydrogenase family)
MSTQDPIAGRTVLITGANRGLGQALVEEALRRGARRVYAGTRHELSHPDKRVVPLRLDITDSAHIAAAAKTVEELDVLINNAGAASFARLEDRAELERQLAVNFFGPYEVANAFRRHLTKSRGTVVNVLSTAAVAPLPAIPAYSISKAAAFSLTQVMRAVLAPEGVRVHAVIAGPIDTAMSKDIDVPKTAPGEVARAILDGVADGDEEVFPDPVAALLAEDWSNGSLKAMQRQNAMFLGS